MWTCELWHWHTYLIWGQRGWPRSHCPGRAAGCWAQVQSGQSWSDRTPHSPRDSPSPSAGAPSSHTPPSAEDRQTPVRLDNRKTSLTNKTQLQCQKVQNNVYTHHIYLTRTHTMLKIKITAGTSISTLIKRLFLVYVLQNPQHQSFVQQELQHENVNPESFLKIIKFKCTQKKGTRICSLEGRVDDQCHCSIMQYW